MIGGNGARGALATLALATVVLVAVVAAGTFSMAPLSDNWTGRITDAEDQDSFDVVDGVVVPRPPQAPDGGSGEESEGPVVVVGPVDPNGDGAGGANGGDTGDGDDVDVVVGPQPGPGGGGDPEPVPPIGPTPPPTPPPGGYTPPVDPIDPGPVDPVDPVDPFEPTRPPDHFGSGGPLIPRPGEGPFWPRPVAGPDPDEQAKDDDHARKNKAKRAKGKPPLVIKHPRGPKWRPALPARQYHPQDASKWQSAQPHKRHAGKAEPQRRRHADTPKARKSSERRRVHAPNPPRVHRGKASDGRSGKHTGKGHRHGKGKRGRR